jgi:hypothetical protein
MAKGLPGTAGQAFKPKLTTPSDDVSFEAWRHGSRDDQVLSSVSAVWLAETD